MKIVVDADACPVKGIITEVAKKYHIQVFMYADTSHCFEDPYATVVTVDKGSDSADLAIANFSAKGDVAVTQDYGLATLLLAKQVHVLNQNGFAYTQDNIDKLLFERHMHKKARRIGKYGPHIKKRTPQMDQAFWEAFESLLIGLLG